MAHLISVKTLIGWLLIVGVASLVVWLLVPLGPPSHETGIIEGFGLSEGRRGSHRIAVVRINGASAQVRISSRIDCQIGDEIELNRQSVPFRQKFTPALTPHPCYRRG
jgi:hypothetical protein